MHVCRKVLRGKHRKRKKNTQLCRHIGRYRAETIFKPYVSLSYIINSYTNKISKGSYQHITFIVIITAQAIFIWMKNHSETKLHAIFYIRTIFKTLFPNLYNKNKICAKTYLTSCSHKSILILKTGCLTDNRKFNNE